MTTTSISESYVNVEVDSVKNNERCYSIIDLSRKKVTIIKDYDERVRSKVCELTNYNPFFIEYLGIGDTLSSEDSLYVVTRIS